MTTLITLTLAGSDVGPFNLYSNLDGFTTPVITGVSRTSLVAGYNATLPDWTTEVLVRSTGTCPRDLYLNIAGAPTTTTSTSSSTTTTTTTSNVGTITVSFNAFDKSFTIYSTVPVPQSVFVSAAVSVDGFPNNSCIGAIAGATLTGGTLGLNIGNTVDSASSTSYTGSWFTTTPYRFSTLTIPLSIGGGPTTAYANGDTVTISGILFTIYISKTCI